MLNPNIEKSLEILRNLSDITNFNWHIQYLEKKVISFIIRE